MINNIIVASIKYLSLWIVILCFPFAASGTLTQLTSNAGEIRDLLQTDSATIFAATQGGGIYKSTDSGSSWSHLSGCTERYIWRLAGFSGNPSLVYAATIGGLLKSMDAGNSWSLLTYDEVRAIAVDPFNQNHLLIGVQGAGIYSSTDAGTTFSLSISGLDSVDVTAIAFNPTAQNVVYAGLNSNESGNWGGIFKSTDGGSTWVDWNNPGGNGVIGNKFVKALVVDDQGAIHAGTLNPNTGSGAVYKQNGSGGWSLKKELYGVETLTVNTYTLHTLWAGSRTYGPWKSTDNGSSWTMASPYPPTFMYTGIYSLLIPDATGKALAGVKGLGIYRSANSSGTSGWNFSSTELSADKVRDFTADSSTNRYIGLAGGGVMRSQNSGPWDAINNGLWFRTNPADPNTLIENNLTITNLATSSYDPTTIFAAAWGRGLFKWNFQTSSWVLVSENGLPYNNDPSQLFFEPTGLLVHPADNRIVYYSLFNPNQGVYMRSTSGTWSLVQSGPFSGQGASRIVVSPDNSRLYVLMYDNLPYRSTNDGASWTQVNAIHTGFMRLAFYAIAENPLTPGYALASTNKGLFESLDSGSNWSSKTALGELYSSVLTGLVFSSVVNGRVWAVDRSGGFYCSNDSGSTWYLIVTLNSAISDIKLIDGTIYLITDGSGVWQDSTLECP